MPEKAALLYRDFVRKAVRRSVREWKAFKCERIMAMAAESDIPEADREDVLNYIRNELRGLHEGNVIRYRLHPEDIEDLNRTSTEPPETKKQPSPRPLALSPSITTIRKA